MPLPVRLGVREELAVMLGVGEGVPGQETRRKRQPLTSPTTIKDPDASVAILRAPLLPNMAVPPGPSAKPPVILPASRSGVPTPGSFCTIMLFQELATYTEP